MPSMKMAWTPDPHERLGTVVFPVSCAPGSQAGFNRGVALLHDFWYEAAQPQFARILAADPGCSMAHWGVAMSVFHQIWGRPDAETMALGWAEMQKAEAKPAATARERAYIAALAGFYRPGPDGYLARVQGYSVAMGKVYAANPADVDAGAFYALSLLASSDPKDTSLAHEHAAMGVLTPLFAKAPDNPGVDHYIIHACDNPAMAAEGLAAADHYLLIAQSGPHAYHMPGHIYARLGLWQKDIDSQLGSIRAAEAAGAHGESGVMDEPHSYDFLLYAYLQSGQDARAKATLEGIAVPLKAIAAMPGHNTMHMGEMVPYFETKLPVFYDLETCDWRAAATLDPVAGSPPEVSMLVYWARAVGHGHLHQPAQAKADLDHYDALIAEIKKGPNAYLVEGPFLAMERGEMVAWTAFAAGDKGKAIANMRASADLQDRVGQAEVDVPAREMLADMLLNFGKAREALAEYEVALKLSPNRLNGLYNAGRAAEATGDKAKAQMFYAALLRDTDGGANSGRPELAYAKQFRSTLTAAK